MIKETSKKEAEMKPIIKSIYVKGKRLGGQPWTRYDKTKSERPAWIEIKNLPEGTRFISIRFRHRIYLYQTYLMSGLFLPTDYTKDEMRNFYDKWAKKYDKDVKGAKTNIKAAEFLVSLLDKYNLSKDIKILDLGCGTGILDEILVKNGYRDITLIDYSKEMLNKAKKKALLKSCKFVRADIKELNLDKKYDLITSLFSFGSSSYFKKEDMPILFKTVNKHLNKKGLFLTLGHFKAKEYAKPFKTLESGECKLVMVKYKGDFWADYFLGRKK